MELTAEEEGLLASVTARFRPAHFTVSVPKVTPLDPQHSQLHFTQFQAGVQTRPEPWLTQTERLSAQLDTQGDQMVEMPDAVEELMQVDLHRLVPLPRRDGVR